ncbi:hypothetical protein ACVWZK_002705 [Bradyrhizobium sp. GM0.4]
MNDMQWAPIGSEPLPPPLPPTRVDFTGNRTEFRKLVTKGALLELVTFGFYRFWLVTDIRRHLWANTAVDGDAAEYTGRAKELLVGFLFALAILVPIYLAYFLVGIEFERWQGFASTPLFISFYAFGQFAIFRARRYRLTRTVWRGVRFWMDGSGWAYSFRAMLWGLLVFLTLGLALPWREASLERYKMRHTHYGDLRGDFEGDGWTFFKRGWWLWLLSPIAMVIFPLAPFFYAEFKAREWRWWLDGIRIGDVSVSSQLPHNAFYALYWKVIGWWMLLSAIFAAYYRRSDHARRQAERSFGRAGVGAGQCRQEHPDAGDDGDRLLRTRSRPQHRHAGLSPARSLGQGAGNCRGAQHRSRGGCARQRRARQRARRRLCRWTRCRGILSCE